jgi:hypothetical protein
MTALLTDFAMVDVNDCDGNDTAADGDVGVMVIPEEVPLSRRLREKIEKTAASSGRRPDWRVKTLKKLFGHFVGKKATNNDRALGPQPSAPRASDGDAASVVAFNLLAETIIDAPSESRQEGGGGGGIYPQLVCDFVFSGHLFILSCFHCCCESLISSLWLLFIAWLRGELLRLHGRDGTGAEPVALGHHAEPSFGQQKGKTKKTASLCLLSLLSYLI